MADSSLPIYDHPYNNVICLSLNSLVQHELESGSELAYEIMDHIGIHGEISSNFVFSVLKQHLDKIELQKPILLIDRKIKLNSAPICAENSEVHVKALLNDNDDEIPNDNAIKIEFQNENLSEVSAVRIEEDGVPKKKYQSRFPWLINCHRRIEPQSNKICESVQNYFKKMKGDGTKQPYDLQFEALISFIISFIGIGILTSIDYYQLIYTSNTSVIGSFGALAVLLFGAIKSPLAQPRNLIFGHIQAALIGVTMQILLGSKLPWLAATLAVSLSISMMNLTHTVHPPAGATALIAVYSDQKIHNLGFLYAILPVGVGVIILLIVALIMNNIFPSRRYPLYWY